MPKHCEYSPSREQAGAGGQSLGVQRRLSLGANAWAARVGAMEQRSDYGYLAPKSCHSALGHLRPHLAYCAEVAKLLSFIQPESVLTRSASPVMVMRSAAISSAIFDMPIQAEVIASKSAVT